LEKYLGNKRSLIDSIYTFIELNTSNTSSIIDIFAGTTNVGRYFKNKGYQVTSNDINRFSYILGLSYLSLKSIPQYGNIQIPKRTQSDISYLEEHFMKQVKKDKGQLYTFKQNELKRFLPVLNILDYLNKLEHFIPENTYMIDYFTTNGKYSNYTSLRGTELNRNYFSKENAIKINNILEKIREWWQNNLLSKQEIAILLTAVIEEIVLVANVAGTFHDFHRNKLWTNSLQTFTLKLPLSIISKTTSTIYCDDALELAKNLPYHDILYIDPPYNFRQYTSYYHLLNFVAAYPFLKDLDKYMKDLNYVRGQNPADEFKSKFCFKGQFIEALRYLIENINCKYVVMSYYGGKNHWNHWTKKEDKYDTGFHKINKIFQDRNIFKSSSAQETFQLRQNFQSRIGEKKQYIDEYLFFGEKATYAENRKLQNGYYDTIAGHNKNFELNFFNYYTNE